MKGGVGGVVRRGWNVVCTQRSIPQLEAPELDLAGPSQNSLGRKVCIICKGPQGGRKGRLCREGESNGRN